MSKRPWLTFELNHLLNDFATIPNLNVLASRIGRSRKEIEEKAKLLGLVRQVPTHRPAMRTRPTMQLAGVSRDEERPTRQDGMKLVAQWRDKDLTQESVETLESIIYTLRRLRKDDVGLWEELILDTARKALKSTQSKKAA